jgi:small-conductance mechanosensitive channel
MTRIPSCLRHLLAVLLLILLCGLVPAVAATAALATAPTLDTLRSQLTSIPAKLDEGDDIRDLMASTRTIQGSAETIALSRKSQLDELDARLAELGAAPEHGGAGEANDLSRQRSELQKQRATVDKELKLARLIAVDAQQKGADLVGQRRARFQAELTARVDSPIDPTFWRALRQTFPTDVARLRALSQETGNQFSTAQVVGLLVAALLAMAGVWVAERTLLRLAPDKLPQGRLRRSLLAVCRVLAHVVIVGIAAEITYTVLKQQSSLSADWNDIGRTAIRLSMFAAFVVGLGRALLANRHESWRLMPLSNTMAASLRPLPWTVALVLSLVGVLKYLTAAAGASLVTEVSAHVLSTLALTGVVAWLLRRLGRNLRSGDSPAEDDSPPALWLPPLMAVLWIILVAIWICLALGFVALASFSAFQVVWTGLISATFYLLFKFADDVATALLSSRSNVGLRMQAALSVTAQTMDQSAVIVSAISRLALFFYMVIALLAPFGTTPDELFQRSGRFGTGFKVGEIQLVPQALFTAIAVAFGGFLALRVFKRWLTRKYLPHTSMEPGMRTSVTTLLGYAGGVMVVALALSAVGIGVERIAWVASALSVGIGFGLQAIVQNFISGLILLAERPVKVGDWVVLGGMEGDVKRINVRATEIRLGDRSTLIVPNSEFITKSVRNMTLANAEGRVQIRLPMPLTTDASQVRSVMMEAFSQHEGVLNAPAASVQLDGIDNGYLVFIGTAFVQGPRAVSNTRSDLLFTILDGLKAANLPLATPAFTVSANDGLPRPVQPPAAPAAAD